MIPDPENTLGVILAGGLSRRMEGTEKSLLKLEEQTLIERVSERLSRQLHTHIVNANDNPARFEFLNLAVQPDTIEGHPGPLAGVLAGMRWAEENNPDKRYVLTVAADTPFFPQNYASKLFVEVCANGDDIALAGSNGRRHPVFGLWPINLADELEAFLVHEEGRKVMQFVQRFNNCTVEFSTVDGYDPFFNVNTPEDLKMAISIAKVMGAA